MGSIDGKGRLSPTRLVVDGLEPWSNIGEALASHALDFSRSERMMDTESRNCGWVTSGEMDSADFSDRELWEFTTCSVFYFREDRKVVDSGAKKRMINQKLKDWLQENNRRRAPATIKADIKTAVENELTKNSPVRAKIVQVATDWHEGWAIVLSQNDETVDLIVKLLNQTFAELQIRFSRVRAANLIKEDVPEAGFGNNFLKKLWQDLDEGEEIWLDGFKFSLGKDAVLRGEGTTTTIKGGIRKEEIEAALCERKAFSSLGISFSKDENAYEMVITAELQIKDLVRPPICSGDHAGDVLVGMNLYNEANGAMNSLVEWFKRSQQ